MLRLTPTLATGGTTSLGLLLLHLPSFSHFAASVPNSGGAHPHPLRVVLPHQEGQECVPQEGCVAQCGYPVRTKDWSHRLHDQGEGQGEGQGRGRGGAGGEAGEGEGGGEGEGEGGGAGEGEGRGQANTLKWCIHSD